MDVKKIISNGGIEFVNQVIAEYCCTKGIIYEISTTRTSQQNGVAERRNRILKEAAKSMLAEIEMNERYWSEAINTAYYTQNKCMINKQHRKMPYEVYMKEENLVYLIFTSLDVNTLYSIMKKNSLEHFKSSFIEHSKHFKLRTFQASGTNLCW